MDRRSARAGREDPEAARRQERNGRAVGRYLMNVHVQPEATQIAILEGRSLIEHYVSRPADDVTQIHGNIYLGKVQNVLPGMEAAFVDIGTPKNAVLYRGDVRYDGDDVDSKRRAAPGSSTCCKAKQLDPVPGHQEPDRPQGRPPDPGGLAAGPVRGPGAQLRRPTASRSACPTTSASGSVSSSTGSSRRARTDRAHRRRRCHRGGDRTRRPAPDPAVGPDLAARGDAEPRPVCSTSEPDMAIRVNP